MLLPWVGGRWSGSAPQDKGGKVSEPQAKGFASLAQRLVEDAKAYALAEFAFYRALAADRADDAAAAGLFIGAAVMLANAVLIAVMLGLMMLLAGLIGAGWAVLVVLLGGSVIVAVLLMLGRARLRDALKPVEEEFEP